MHLSNFHVSVILLSFTQTQVAVAQNTVNGLGCFNGFNGYNIFSGTNCNSSILGYDSSVLPWSWVVTPDTPELQAECPSVFKTISMFVAVNIIAAILMAIFGNSAIRRRIMFGHCQKERPKENLVRGSCVAIALTLLANLGVACLIKYTPGYGSGFAIWELWLFYATRPRFGWVVSVALSPFGRERKSGGQTIDNAWLSHSARSDPRLFSGQRLEKEYFWLAAANSAIIAECVLQLFALYNMMSAVVGGLENGMYNHLSLPMAERRAIYIMTIGALLFCVTRIPLNLLMYMMFGGYRFRIGADGSPRRKNAYLLIPLVPVLWLPQWAFFGGFISLAGHAYCPPKLVTQGSIWAGAALLSTLLGGSM